MKTLLLSCSMLAALVFYTCTKKAGKNPSLAWTDLALLDSCKASSHRYYKNDTGLLHKAAGSNSPHGPFKLRFNSIAFKALTDSGRLPVNAPMPEGAMVIKDVYKDGKLDLYALMYKHSGSWLWAEIKPNKQVLYSVSMDPGTCTGCHNQAGNRDLLVSFAYY